MVSTIVYGEAPPGFSVSVPAEPLAPGCYVASVSASGYEEAEVYFWIADDRSVRA